jgi:hypothetical protein
MLSAGGSSAQVGGQAEALTRASQRGALLYAYDQAAWHGTDDMLSKIADPANKLGGYIVDGPANAPRLVFFDKAGSAAVYVATFNGNHLVEGHVLGPGDDHILSALDQRMVRALGAARAALVADGSARPCAAKPFNTVVLPPDSTAGPVSVYFLTPQTSTDVIPFGGHYEIDVDASGKAGSIRRFTNSCLNMPTRPRLPNGAKLEAIFVTHLLDPVPTEIHVFNSLVTGMPVMVGTASPEMVWPVHGDRIGSPTPLTRQP